MQIEIKQNKIEQVMNSLEEEMHVCFDTKNNSITGYVTKVKRPSTVRLSKEPFERNTGFLSFIPISHPGKDYDIRDFQFYEILPN